MIVSASNFESNNVAREITTEAESNTVKAVSAAQDSDQVRMETPCSEEWLSRPGD